MDIFISYSYRDEVELPLALFLLLRDEGCKPYLSQRFSRKKGQIPNIKDIQKTRDILSVSKSLIFLDGPEATRSQWIPWEIGYIAGKNGKVAIFTAAENQSNVTNSEFLSLYPKVSHQDGCLLVDKDSREKIGLYQWVNA
ncbi:TIR domain-containing protein [Komagataeibacter nataicola]|uniref:TIR domain-containing protein n=1 Tax=Komagataeibacter nataicola TaxID=265960 RepID=UPI0014756503|nr:TIR domain-containing protein [Komagataeibacter nataicola]WNM07530.1 TIR domain-containing protein [Komagataeibacter nataicola]GBR21967.1 hypothetical protein AA0616_2159 [Komagataeibacter nataicola NRIC 0616]